MKMRTALAVMLILVILGSFSYITWHFFTGLWINVLQVIWVWVVGRIGVQRPPPKTPKDETKIV